MKLCIFWLVMFLLPLIGLSQNDHSQIRPNKSFPSNVVGKYGIRNLESIDLNNTEQNDNQQPSLIKDLAREGLENQVKRGVSKEIKKEVGKNLANEMGGAVGELAGNLIFGDEDEKKEEEERELRLQQNRREQIKLDLQIDFFAWLSEDQYDLTSSLNEHYFFIVNKAEKNVISFSLFNVTTNLYNQLPYKVDLAETYRNETNSFQFWISGPFSNLNEARASIDEIAKKAFDHFIRVVDDTKFVYNQPESLQSLNLNSNTFWGVFKDGGVLDESREANAAFQIAQKTYSNGGASKSDFNLTLLYLDKVIEQLNTTSPRIQCLRTLANYRSRNHIAAKNDMTKYFEIAESNSDPDYLLMKRWESRINDFYEDRMEMARAVNRVNNLLDEELRKIDSTQKSLQKEREESGIAISFNLQPQSKFKIDLKEKYSGIYSADMKEYSLETEIKIGFEILKASQSDIIMTATILVFDRKFQNFYGGKESVKELKRIKGHPIQLSLSMTGEIEILNSDIFSSNRFLDADYFNVFFERFFTLTPTEKVLQNDSWYINPSWIDSEFLFRARHESFKPFKVRLNSISDQFALLEFFKDGSSINGDAKVDRTTGLVPFLMLNFEEEGPGNFNDKLNLNWTIESW